MLRTFIPFSRLAVHECILHTSQRLSDGGIANHFHFAPSETEKSIVRRLPLRGTIRQY
jgi:hypothetical protein